MLVKIFMTYITTQNEQTTQLNENLELLVMNSKLSEPAKKSPEFT